MNRLTNDVSHEWHVAINKHNEGKGHGEFVHFMYEAKRAADEVPRMTKMFELERTDGLKKIHQQCSHSMPEPIKENYLSCCLGERCSQCPYLLSLDSAKLTPEEIDQAKAWTCATHILTESGKRQFLDTSEGFLLTEDDKMFWQQTYASMAEPNPDDKSEIQ